MKEIKVSFSITLVLDRCDVNYVEEELLKKRCPLAHYFEQNSQIILGTSIFG
jgi:hypothetical protein